MKKWLLLGALAALGALAIGSVLVKRHFQQPEVEWTTASPEARAAYERGLDAMAKFYWGDAYDHFTRALELDPEFVAAKLQLQTKFSESAEEKEVALVELEAVDTSRLTDRERFLVEYWTAKLASRFDDAHAVLDAYLEIYPEDAYAIATECEESWSGEAWDAAERCYSRLIDLHPNWVQAQSRLGLIAMALGRFDQAEEYFRTYHFIAPDQAAPYDSLGQLAAVRGYYEDAERSLGQALGIKGDFCEARWHRVRLFSMWNREDEAAKALDELKAEGSCSYYERWGAFCSQEAWIAYARGDIEGASAIFTEGCLERRGGFDLIAHRLALMNGDWPGAIELEEALTGRLERQREEGDEYQFYGNYLKAAALHLKGTRMMAEGDREKSCKLLAHADSMALYWGIERAIFKLYNRRQLMLCQQLAGRDERAEKVRRQIVEVNPRYLDDYDLPELPGTQLPPGR